MKLLSLGPIVVLHSGCYCTEHSHCLKRTPDIDGTQGYQVIYQKPETFVQQQCHYQHKKKFSGNLRGLKLWPNLHKICIGKISIFGIADVQRFRRICFLMVKLTSKKKKKKEIIGQNLHLLNPPLKKKTRNVRQIIQMQKFHLKLHSSPSYVHIPVIPR